MKWTIPRNKLIDLIDFQINFLLFPVCKMKVLRRTKFVVRWFIRIKVQQKCLVDSDGWKYIWRMRQDGNPETPSPSQLLEGLSISAGASSFSPSSFSCISFNLDLVVGMCMYTIFINKTIITYKLWYVDSKLILKWS